MAQLIDIPKFTDDKGTIYIADREFPFDIRRVLWVTDVGEGRGEKAQRRCEQVYVAVRGRMLVDVLGNNWKTYELESPDKGLYLPKMTWRRIKEPSDGAILLVLCSERYDPYDKIADINDFVHEAGL